MYFPRSPVSENGSVDGGEAAAAGAGIVQRAPFSDLLVVALLVFGVLLLLALTTWRRARPAPVPVKPVKAPPTT